MSEVIPEAAVEAARAAVRAAMIEFGPDGHTDGDEEITRAALEAAAPHMLAGVAALAAQWETEGEQSMDAAKKIADEGMATMLLMDGATMVENARLIRNAIGTTK